MKRLIIIGARGFGREVFNLATQCEGYGREFCVKGFLDDKKDALDGLCGYPAVLGDVESYTIEQDDVFVCALGEPEHKKHYVEIMLGKGGVFTSLVHPSSVIASNTLLGQGSIVLPGVYLSCDLCLGDFITLQPFCVIGHDARIDSFCHLNSYAFMGGYAQLEEGVTLHTGAKVLPHKKVGAWATVGAGSVVLRNVKSGVTVFGLPALPIGV
jgi:sugar O-acyltransferase (sialic acid O-acetyltransferase NeuD family)